MSADLAGSAAELGGGLEGGPPPTAGRGGAALACDSGAVVRRVLRDDLGAFGPEAVGKPFPLTLERDSFRKGLDFVAEARKSGAAFDYELTVATAEGPRALHFAAAVDGDGLTVVCEREPSKLYGAFEDLAAALAERVDLERGRERERARAAAEREQVSFESVAALNNELVDMQRELARKNARLKELSELKDRFVAMAAHDLRSPLTAVAMYADFLMGDADRDDPERRREYLKVIRGSVDFMVGLIDSLLDVTGIEAGGLGVDLRPGSLPELAARYAARMAPVAEARGIALRFDSEGLPDFLFDPIRVEQLMANLVGNGLKFVPSGGTVLLSLRRDGGDAILEVRDDGPGIAPEDQARLFSYFGRGSSRSPHGERSTGLGLAICKRIVEAHGGAIRLESAPGEGTTVVVRLPLEGADSSAR